MSRLLNHGSCGLYFIEADIVRADNGNDNAVSHVDGGLEQRAEDCLACSLCSLVRCRSGAGADVEQKPASFMTEVTSAKSRLMKPGTVISSEMFLTA